MLHPLEVRQLGEQRLSLVHLMRGCWCAAGGLTGCWHCRTGPLQVIAQLTKTCACHPRQQLLVAQILYWKASDQAADCHHRCSQGLEMHEDPQQHPGHRDQVLSQGHRAPLGVAVPAQVDGPQ